MRRLCLRASRLLTAAFFLVAFFAPSAYAALPSTVEITASEQTVNVAVTLESAALLFVTFDSLVACSEFSHAQHLDPYLWLYADDGTLLAYDDDGNHNDQNCYGAKLYAELKSGAYVVRFGSYGTTVGIGYVTWGTDVTPASTTTTTTTTTVAPTTTSVPTTTSSSTTTVASTTTTTSVALSTSTTSAPATTSTTTTTQEPTPTTTSSSSSTTSSTTTVAPTTSTTTTTVPTTVVTSPPTTTTTTTSTIPVTTTTVTAWTTTTSTTTTSTSTSLPSTTTTALEESPTSTIGSPTTTRPVAPTSPSSSTTTSTSTTSPRSATTTTTQVSPPSSVPLVVNSSTTSTTSPFSTPTTTISKSVTVAAETGDEQLTAAVVAVLDGEIDSDELADLIDAGFVDAPTEVVEAVVEALQAAPVEVRQQLEAQVNVFGGALDSYVPIGSNVSVAERRTIVAITATVASPLSPVTAVRRRR